MGEPTGVTMERVLRERCTQLSRRRHGRPSTRADRTHGKTERPFGERRRRAILRQPAYRPVREKYPANDTGSSAPVSRRCLELSSERLGG